MPRKKDTIKLEAQSTATNTDIRHLAKKTSRSLLSKITLDILKLKNGLVLYNKARFNVFNNKRLQIIFSAE